MTGSMSQIKIILAFSHINSSPAQATELNQKHSKDGSPITGVSLFTLKYSSLSAVYLLKDSLSLHKDFLISMKKTKTEKKVVGLILVAVVAIAGVIYICNAKVVSASADRCFECVDSLPECETGILLGTSIRGRYTDVNPYFRPRINGILDLYRAGKIKRIYITGDSASVDYNEPRWMADTLIAEGVPAEVISLDFNGSHTLESVKHAAEFTGGRPYIVVSQRFHNERFIYMAREQGIDVWGLNCGNFMHRNILQFRQRCREALSRVKAVMFD